MAAVNIWLGGFLTPFIGYVMDRYGAQWLLIISSVVFGVRIGLIGLSNSVGYLLLCLPILSLWSPTVAFPPRERRLFLVCYRSLPSLGPCSLVQLPTAWDAKMSWG